MSDTDTATAKPGTATQFALKQVDAGLLSVGYAARLDYEHAVATSQPQPSFTAATPATSPGP